MLSKIKNLIISLGFLVTLLAPLAAPAAVSAACDPTQTDPSASNYCATNPQNGVCSGANNLAIPDNGTNQSNPGECGNTNGGTSKVNSVIRTILNVLTAVIGIVAVIMIIVGGFHYVTSGGSQEKVKKAKDTLLYAIIGIIIAALAQIIVKFVLDKSIHG